MNTTSPRFSICIPNYNYERYLKQTLDSVLAQSAADTACDFEVLISDNASTDASVEVARAFGDPRIQVSQNACNVGFSANLDRAAARARGDVMLMLSSDDVCRPLALQTYARLFDMLPNNGAAAVVSSRVDVIDADGTTTSQIGPDTALWSPGSEDRALTQALGATVYRVRAADMAARCLASMKNPFNFLATAYPRVLYQKLEGYGAGRLVNPDKWFHWRLLGVADEVFYVDTPLFAYRWHDKNQSSQQDATGALKFLVDEYATTLEVDAALLAKAHMTREALVEAFVEHDIVRHGLATLARGNKAKARRVLDFGRAVYPWAVDKNPKAKILASLLAMDRVGVSVAKAAYLVAQRRGAVTRGEA